MAKQILNEESEYFARIEIKTPSENLNDIDSYPITLILGETYDEYVGQMWAMNSIHNEEAQVNLITSQELNLSMKSFAVGVKNEGECSTFEEDLEDKRGFASVIEAVQIDDPTIFI